MLPSTKPLPVLARTPSLLEEQTLRLRGGASARVSTGSHLTAPLSDVTMAGNFQRVRNTYDSRGQYWRGQVD
jgi:hypothetical protein